MNGECCQAMRGALNEALSECRPVGFFCNFGRRSKLSGELLGQIRSVHGSFSARWQH